MKPEEEQNDRILHLLKKCRLAESTPGRREQAMEKARAAWTVPVSEKPAPQWRPMLRFAAAIAATVVLVAIAHLWDSRSLARRLLPPAPQEDNAVTEIAGNDPVLARELMSFHAIRVYDTDRVAADWLKQQELLRELLNLESPGISNGLDEPPASRKQGGLGKYRLMV